MLVALRLWSPDFRDGRIFLSARTDNMATLSLVAKMQPHSENLGLIARETALDISHMSYFPDVIQHIPGIANTCADALSHRFEPNTAVTGILVLVSSRVLVNSKT